MANLFPADLHDALDPDQRALLIERAQRRWRDYNVWERRGQTWVWPLSAFARGRADTAHQQWEQLVPAMLSAGIHPIFEGRTPSTKEIHA